MLRMLKKVFLSVFVVVLVGVVWFGYGALNLKKNSVYYAQHTPHSKGVEPVLMEVTRNLDWIYTPDIKGIKYDYDGSRTIYNENYQDGAKLAIFSFSSDPRYLYCSEKFIIYAFDDHFKLLSATDRQERTISIKEINQTELIREIYRVVQPVVDAQSEPLFNLQWVYDWVNKDRFN